MRSPVLTSLDRKWGGVLCCGVGAAAGHCAPLAASEHCRNGLEPESC